MLRESYPWRMRWDVLAIDQVAPPEAAGKKFSAVCNRYLYPLRVGIAHALLKNGEVGVTLDRLDHIREVNKWLPLCRTLARTMLRNEFPREFELR
jgi:hypothetical protein